MNHLILTGSDLETIQNALSNLAAMCCVDASNAPDTPAGKWLAAAARESAAQYIDLAKRLAEADRITVELG